LHYSKHFFISGKRITGLDVNCSKSGVTGIKQQILTTCFIELDRKL